MKRDLDALRLFNRKVTRLEETGLMARFGDSTPEVVAYMEPLTVEATGAGNVEMTGRVWSYLEGFSQDEIDAFVLTYRMFIQNNDRISIGSLAKIYERDWMPAEAAASFRSARAQVNKYLDSSCTVMVGDEKISIQRLVQVIVYGGLAHTNREKEQEFSAWMNDGGVAGFFWAEFVVAMKEMMRFLSFFKTLNEAVLSRIAV